MPLTPLADAALGRRRRRRRVRCLTRMALFCFAALAREELPVWQDAPKQSIARTKPARCLRVSLDQWAATARAPVQMAANVARVAHQAIAVAASSAPYIA